jgi:hypothetical protein
VQEQPAEPATIQDTIIWSSHTFLQAHLPLTEDSAASMQQQQRWEARLQDSQQQQQQQQQLSSGQTQSNVDSAGEAASAIEAAVKAAGAAFARAAAAVGAPAGAPASSEQDSNGDSNSSSNTGRIMLSTSGRRDSLVDHLAADETLIAADEAAAGGDVAGSAAAEAAAPVAHSEKHDLALENASSAELSAVAGQVHLPVKPQEEQQYKQRLGADAYLVAVHTR